MEEVQLFLNAKPMDVEEIGRLEKMIKRDNEEHKRQEVNKGKIKKLLADIRTKLNEVETIVEQSRIDIPDEFKFVERYTESAEQQARKVLEKYKVVE